ncbi:hypothetical protein B296_00028643 [Ensete ventricosum]|uniref:Uncharacterized protein n=1 Tax=Ensete ventricosum TaxID=4639 RepID=A0A426YY18_ENSVE|nr:hypothetical protein B296_00028643 [Ensete ventricosum]
MTSVDLIGVKLEAFEKRIKDRIRALFAEFRLGQSPSSRRSQRGESSNCKENPPDKEEQATNSSYPRIRVDFLRWEDGSPTGFEHLSNQTQDWSEKQLLGAFIEGLKPEIICEVKVRQPDHRCKRGKLLVIEPIENPEPEDIDPELEKEEAKEEPQPTISTIHTLVGYANSQSMKVDGFLKHQPITILIDTESTNNFMDSKMEDKPTTHKKLKKNEDPRMGTRNIHKTLGIRNRGRSKKNTHLFERGEVPAAGGLGLEPASPHDRPRSGASEEGWLLRFSGARLADQRNPTHLVAHT